MDYPITENNTHSFIIKIWSDEPSTDQKDTIWHGQATNVITGEKFEFKDLAQLEKFLYKNL